MWIIARHGRKKKRHNTNVAVLWRIRLPFTFHYHALLQSSSANPLRIIAVERGEFEIQESRSFAKPQRRLQRRRRKYCSKNCITIIFLFTFLWSSGLYWKESCDINCYRNMVNDIKLGHDVKKHSSIHHDHFVDKSRNIFPRMHRIISVMTLYDSNFIAIFITLFSPCIIARDVATWFIAWNYINFWNGFPTSQSFHYVSANFHKIYFTLSGTADCILSRLSRWMATYYWSAPSGSLGELIRKRRLVSSGHIYRWNFCFDPLDKLLEAGKD